MYIYTHINTLSKIIDIIPMIFPLYLLIMFFVIYSIKIHIYYIYIYIHMYVCIYIYMYILYIYIYIYHLSCLRGKGRLFDNKLVFIMITLNSLGGVGKTGFSSLDPVMPRWGFSEEPFWPLVITSPHISQFIYICFKRILWVNICMQWQEHESETNSHAYSMIYIYI